MRLIKSLFPQIEGEWGYVNVAKIAECIVGNMGLQTHDPNPFLDPVIVDRWMEFVHDIKEIDYSWGGYLEDRSVLWRGHYHQPGEVIHLGVDVNVPAGTEVFMPTWGILAHSFQDPDQNGGWGGKIIFQCTTGAFEGLYLIFGHLKDIPHDIGTKYIPGQKIGVIAEAEINGGWAPHLHVQLMREFLPNVDGYAAHYEGIEDDFPNPVP